MQELDGCEPIIELSQYRTALAKVKNWINSLNAQMVANQTAMDTRTNGIQQLDEVTNNGEEGAKKASVQESSEQIRIHLEKKVELYQYMVREYEVTIVNHDNVDESCREGKLVNLQLASFLLDSERIKMAIKAEEIAWILDQVRPCRMLDGELSFFEQDLQEMERKTAQLLIDTRDNLEKLKDLSNTTDDEDSWQKEVRIDLQALEKSLPQCALKIEELRSKLSLVVASNLKKAQKFNQNKFRRSQLFSQYSPIKLLTFTKLFNGQLQYIQITEEQILKLKNEHKLPKTPKLCRDWTEAFTLLSQKCDKSDDFVEYVTSKINEWNQDYHLKPSYLSLQFSPAGDLIFEIRNKERVIEVLFNEDIMSHTKLLNSLISTLAMHRKTENDDFQKLRRQTYEKMKLYCDLKGFQHKEIKISKEIYLARKNLENLVQQKDSLQEQQKMLIERVEQREQAYNDNLRRIAFHSEIIQMRQCDLNLLINSLGVNMLTNAQLMKIISAIDDTRNRIRIQNEIRDIQRGSQVRLYFALHNEKIAEQRNQSIFQRKSKQIEEGVQQIRSLRNIQERYQKQLKEVSSNTSQALQKAAKDIKNLLRSVHTQEQNEKKFDEIVEEEDSTCFVVFYDENWLEDSRKKQGESDEARHSDTRDRRFTSDQEFFDSFAQELSE